MRSPSEKEDEWALVLSSVFQVSLGGSVEKNAAKSPTVSAVIMSAGACVSFLGTYFAHLDHRSLVLRAYPTL